MAVYPEVRVREFKGSGGLPLAADVCGEPMAPPVVLLHGGGQTRHSWGTAMRELAAQGYYVINLDARGHGDSGWAPDGDYSSAAMVQDLACVIDVLASPPALVGASMGGATALTLVGTSPMSAATALVLVDIVPTVNPEGAKKIQAFMSGNVHGFATLEEAADAVSAGERDARVVTEIALERLREVSVPDYVVAVEAHTLRPLSVLSGDVRLLASSVFGSTPLVDNVGVTVPAS